MLVEGKTEIYAHSLPGKPAEEWETLDTHSAEVAKLARGFADAFGGAEWALSRLFGMTWERFSRPFNRISLEGTPLERRTRGLAHFTRTCEISDCFP